MAETDLSKIVNLIMENPKLIEEIRTLTEKKQDEKEDSEPTEATPTEERKEDSAPVINVSTGSVDKSRRRELLSALKPYVSKERAKAIDSMLSIADVLEIMKTK